MEYESMLYVRRLITKSIWNFFYSCFAVAVTKTKTLYCLIRVCAYCYLRLSCNSHVKYGDNKHYVDVLLIILRIDYGDCLF